MDKLKVLLADDHVVIRNSLKQILADTEDFIVAGDAANGLEVMQKFATRIGMCWSLSFRCQGATGWI